MEVAQEVPIRVVTERCERKLPMRAELESCKQEMHMASATPRWERGVQPRGANESFKIQMKAIIDKCKPNVTRRGTTN